MQNFEEKGNVQPHTSDATEIPLAQDFPKDGSNSAAKPISSYIKRIEDLREEEKAEPSETAAFLTDYLAGRFGATPTPEDPAAFLNTIRDNGGDTYSDAIDKAEELLNALDSESPFSREELESHLDQLESIILDTAPVYLDTPNLIQEVPISMIESSTGDFNHRVISPPTDALEESVRLDGQLNPIVLRKHPDENVSLFQILAGHLLLAVAIDLGLKTVKARILPGHDDREALLFSIKDNLLREQYSPIDLGYIALRMRKEGFTQNEIKTHLEKGAKTIDRYVHLAQMPDYVQELILNKSITPEHAEALYQCQRRVPDLDLGEWTDQVVSRDLTAKQLKTELNKAYPTEGKKPEPLVKNKDGKVSIKVDLNTLEQAKQEEALRLIEELSALLGIASVDATTNEPQEASSDVPESRQFDVFSGTALANSGADLNEIVSNQLVAGGQF